MIILLDEEARAAFDNEFKSQLREDDPRKQGIANAMCFGSPIDYKFVPGRLQLPSQYEVLRRIPVQAIRSSIVYCATFTARYFAASDPSTAWTRAAETGGVALMFFLCTWTLVGLLLRFARAARRFGVQWMYAALGLAFITYSIGLVLLGRISVAALTVGGQVTIEGDTAFNIGTIAGEQPLNMTNSSNRCLLVLLDDTRLDERDCKRSLACYGSIKRILLTSDRRAAFIDFECEHAPLLVARCFALHLRNPGNVPMPKGASSVLPACSVNNFLYLHDVPRSLSTAVLERKFNSTSIFRAGIGGDDGLFPVVIKYEEGLGVHLNEMKQFQLNWNVDDYEFFAIPHLPLLTDSSGVLVNDGCGECMVVSLRSSIVELEGDTVVPPVIGLRDVDSDQSTPSDPVEIKLESGASELDQFQWETSNGVSFCEDREGDWTMTPISQLFPLKSTETGPYREPLPAIPKFWKGHSMRRSHKRYFDPVPSLAAFNGFHGFHDYERGGRLQNGERNEERGGGRRRKERKGEKDEERRRDKRDVDRRRKEKEREKEEERRREKRDEDKRRKEKEKEKKEERRRRKRGGRGRKERGDKHRGNYGNLEISAFQEEEDRRSKRRDYDNWLTRADSRGHSDSEAENVPPPSSLSHTSRERGIETTVESIREEKGT